MSSKGSIPQLKVVHGQETIRIEGDLCSETAGALCGELNRITAEPGLRLTLDLSCLDVGDGVGLAEAVRSFRDLHRRSAGLVIVGSPQILAHNLYRVGMLEGNKPVVLIDMRQDEPHE